MGGGAAGGLVPTLRMPFSGERQNLVENLNLGDVAENRKPRETRNIAGTYSGHASTLF